MAKQVPVPAEDPRTELARLNAEIEKQAAQNTITPDLNKRRDALLKQQAVGDFDKNPHAQQ